MSFNLHVAAVGAESAESISASYSLQCGPSSVTSAADSSGETFIVEIGSATDYI